MNRGASKWAVTGWQHMSFERPDDWSIGAVSGDFTTGYLRLDDTEMPRFELRWERTRGRESPDQVVARYLKNLTGKGGKKAPPVKIRRDLALIKDESVLADRTVEGFHWRTEGPEPMQAYGCLWMCETCGRTVFAQVLGRGGESMMTRASRLLSTLDDHARGDTATWAVYGLRIELPSDCVLKHHSFMTGRIELTFQRGGARLELLRMSLAEMHLEGRTFPVWFQDTYGGEIDLWIDDAGPTGGHPSIGGTGQGVDPDTVHARMAWLPWRRPRKKPLSCRGWHCIDGNRIYVLRHLDESHRPDFLDEIAGTVVCH